jgi:hypothetical protein
MWFKYDFFCVFPYRPLWRRGRTVGCHPVGPGSIPGVGAISLWKNLLQMRTWLSRLWFHQCFVRWGWTYPPTSSNFLLAEATTFSSFIGWSKFVCIINSYNFGCFKCMSLWRRGTVLNCHPVGPGSIPGAGIHLHIVTKVENHFYHWFCPIQFVDILLGFSSNSYWINSSICFFFVIINT